MDQQAINELLSAPQESLTFEIKNWINPKEPEDLAKIVKTCLALRNQNGGKLVIGIDDNTRQLLPVPKDREPRTEFHLDNVQSWISKYASEKFEIQVDFSEDNRLSTVIISVPSGVTVPVAACKELNPTGKKVIELDAVYVRTLNANNSPSTAKACWKDWSDLCSRCFENREAQFGKFLRRNLVPSNRQMVTEALQELLGEVSGPVHQESISDEERLVAMLDKVEALFDPNFVISEVYETKIGTWEVFARVNADLGEFRPNQEFLNLLSSANPGLTGWPIWLDSRYFSKEDSRPSVQNGAWVAKIRQAPSGRGHIDYLWMHPEGRFYLKRVLDDDISQSHNAPKPSTEFDFALAILRVAEALVVALSFAKKMRQSTNDDDKVEYAFRWMGLSGRRLDCWAEPGRSLSYDRCSTQNDIISFVTIPLDAAESTLPTYVQAVLTPVFELFDGMEFSPKIYEDLVNRLITRKL